MLQIFINSFDECALIVIVNHEKERKNQKETRHTHGLPNRRGRSNEKSYENGIWSRVGHLLCKWYRGNPNAMHLLPISSIHISHLHRKHRYKYSTFCVHRLPYLLITFVSVAPNQIVFYFSLFYCLSMVYALSSMPSTATQYASFDQYSNRLTAAWHSENYIQQHSPPPKIFLNRIFILNK